MNVIDCILYLLYGIGKALGVPIHHQFNRTIRFRTSSFEPFGCPEREHRRLHIHHYSVVAMQRFCGGASVQSDLSTSEDMFNRARTYS